MLMTKAELSNLRKLAAENGMSASDLVRFLIHKALREHAKESR